MATQVVTYQLDDSTRVSFEVDTVDGFRPAGPGQIVGRVREAVAPAVDAAKAVLEKVKEVGPDEVEVRFGIKVSGRADWLVAKAAGEASFDITLRWAPCDKPALAAPKEVHVVDGSEKVEGRDTAEVRTGGREGVSEDGSKPAEIGASGSGSDGS